ncbi:arylamine N-acetyltransferase family protein [Brevibacillus agri]|uniref:arylamine N-acetyltransferase family protein n=1 Tax=Brevibacillus agri TaxID=51101 RepID=UPI003D7191AE
MSELNALFRKRTGISEHEAITFDKLDTVLEKAALSIPFENLRVIEGKTTAITKENVASKILLHREGGLCYELNSLLYFFLIENGFDAVLTRGVVYRPAEQQYLEIGKTHLTILLAHAGQTYLVDTGFGGNLPLKPVPLSGEVVSSANGEFRVRKENSEHGDHVLEMKLKHKDTDWRIGYAFDANKPIAGLSECDEIQAIIVSHEQSPFNKNPLLTKLTASGNITLTNTSFTQWADGVVTKESIDSARFKELAKQHFAWRDWDSYE